MITTNTNVKTPLGEGKVYGAYSIKSSSGEDIVQGALVRMPVNETTRQHLNRSNCVTPHAILNGLWVFQLKDLEVIGAKA